MQGDGTVKRHVLVKNGGARDCYISHIDIGFDEIHDRMREIFGFGRTTTKHSYSSTVSLLLIDQPNCRTKLYDFEMKELDTDRYTTFLDYIRKRGLRLTGIVLYLYTPDSTMKTFPLN